MSFISFTILSLLALIPSKISCFESNSFCLMLIWSSNGLIDTPIVFFFSRASKALTIAIFSFNSFSFGLKSLNADSFEEHLCNFFELSQGLLN